MGTSTLADYVSEYWMRKGVSQQHLVQCKADLYSRTTPAKVEHSCIAKQPTFTKWNE